MGFEPTTPGLKVRYGPSTAVRGRSLCYPTAQDPVIIVRRWLLSSAQVVVRVVVSLSRFGASDWKRPQSGRSRERGMKARYEISENLGKLGLTRRLH